MSAQENAQLLDRFDQLDRDKDAKITPTELPRPAIFLRFDHNKDGIITRDEVSSSVAPLAVGVWKSDISYGDHSSQKLDVYRPKTTRAAQTPVMIYVHGGGWKRGDKKAVGQKPQFFCGNGWTFVSVNYRLVPEGKHPRNVTDIARAVAWVDDNARTLNIDSDRIFIMGHSAGAHLASLVATHSSVLKNAGKSRRLLKGVISLDTNAYNVTTLPKNETYAAAFGDQQDEQRDASPIHHIANDAGIAPFLIAFSSGLGQRTNPLRSQRATMYAKRLMEAGIQAEVIDASDRNHSEINTRFGSPGDKKVTAAAKKFLDRLCKIESDNPANSLHSATDGSNP